MPEFPLQRVLDGIRATHPAEWLAVISGVVYVLFIMARHRVGWIFGALSSVILMVLAARARLPMNALLQFSYVLAAAYGWWSWSRAPQGRPIGRWHWRGHAVSLAGCVLISLGLAQLLAMDGTSAFPFTDSLVACVGLVATWQVARVYLENWLYWIVVDAVSIYLYFTQGLVVSSLLYVIYLVIATVGFFSWLGKYRRQAASAS
jgi:nicotinamide mononucleotide transporter